MKVLLTTDGSKQAETALQTAGRLLHKGRHQYDLLCVAPRLAFPQSKARKEKPKIARLHQNYQDKAASEAKEILLHAQAQLATQGIEANTIAEVGSPANMILQKAAERDLVVIGAHDRYERSKQGLGPVATRVVAHASSAVLVARELTAGRSLRILLGMDGSLASEYALQVMLRMFDVGTAEITLMHVVETPWIYLGLEREWLDYAESGIDRNDQSFQLERELQNEAEDVLAEVRARLDGVGLSATTLIEEGDPALEILSEAEKDEYDLIVLGATGEHDLKHQLLGSVSTKVAQDAPCSVLVAKYIA
ncbi:MAG: universal stress protein [Acidobacteria bacterium]|nr:universal stress protein [Acidobacteriota bacterium]